MSFRDEMKVDLSKNHGKKVGAVAGLAMMGMAALGGVGVNANEVNSPVQTEATVGEKAEPLTADEKMQMYTAEQIKEEMPPELIYVKDFEFEDTEENMIDFIAAQLATEKMFSLEEHPLTEVEYDAETAFTVMLGVQYILQRDCIFAGGPETLAQDNLKGPELAETALAIEFERIVWDIMNGKNPEELMERYQANFLSPEAETFWAENQALVTAVKEKMEKGKDEVEVETETTTERDDR